MDLYIMTPEQELLGIYDTASSIIWANRHRECGDFEIYTPATADAIDLLRTGYWVTRLDDKMVGVIEGVALTQSEEGGDYLTVTGRCLRSILDRRIIWDQTQLSGTLEDGLRKLVTDAFISPAIEARKYAALRLAEAHGYTDKVNAQFTGDNLLTTVEELCAANAYGFSLYRVEDGVEVDFYKGVDRTVNQTDRVPVIFSETYDNLTASTYTKNTTEYKSVALVAGEGEGSARRRTTVQRSTDLEGLERREMFIDARDISSNEGEITEDEYMAQLAERGNTDLAAASIVESLEGTVELRQMYTYGEDYNLGDLVTVINKYGIQADAQVLEIVETWDENGYTCTPTFG